MTVDQVISCLVFLEKKDLGAHQDGSLDIIKWQEYLEAFSLLDGASSVFRRIRTASTLEDAKDYLAEISFALMFVGAGFSVLVEPLGSKGPDLSVKKNGIERCVEVRRFRSDPSRPGPPEIDPDNPMLQVYGDVKRDVTKAFRKIEEKYRQVGNAPSIIAIANNDNELDVTEVRMAVDKYLSNPKSVPEGLAFILLWDGWYAQQNLYCFHVGVHGDEALQSWIKSIETRLLRKHILLGVEMLQASRGNC